MSFKRMADEDAFECMDCEMVVRSMNGAAPTFCMRCEREADEELRDKFKKRFGYAPAEVEHDWKALLQSHADMKDRAEKAEADLAMMINGHNACGTRTFAMVQKQRDDLQRSVEEWKLRAEAAERQLEILTGPMSASAALDDGEMMKWIGSESRRLKRALATEAGPGIDPRPDNSIAHLPEDLLCEDA